MKIKPFFIFKEHGTHNVHIRFFQTYSRRKKLFQAKVSLRNMDAYLINHADADKMKLCKRLSPELHVAITAELTYEKYVNINVI